MRCPKCGHSKTKQDTAAEVPAQQAYQRYRSCRNPDCYHTFITWERELNPIPQKDLEAFNFFGYTISRQDAFLIYLYLHKHFGTGTKPINSTPYKETDENETYG